jgi:polyisoprenoid-binding protein YceI
MYIQAYVVSKLDNQQGRRSTLEFKLGAGIRVATFAVFILLIVFLSACGSSFSAAASDTSVPGSSAPAAQPTSAPAVATSVIAPGAPSTSASVAAASATRAGTDASQTVRLAFVAGDTVARYRVREQLARISFPSDAVGATKSVTGTIIAKTDGTISAGSKVQVDLSTLTSDESMRDRFIKGGTLQTSTYPYAVFAPSAIEGLALPTKDGPVAFKLIGSLTIRNITKQVTWDVAGTISGNEATGTATTSFTFDYFNLQKPSVGAVLSVEDNV